jgi:Fe2+ or Zn2+ uptake regulation protein
MGKKNQAEREPTSCPFCGHTDLAPSPSHKHLVCRKCGRIIVLRGPPSGKRGPVRTA